MIGVLKLGVPVLLVAALAGCRTPAGPAQSAAPAQKDQPAGRTASSLAGTEWRLVEIQSLDDAIGVKRPADPGQYTMRLQPDGRVTMKLNCNSATGNWSAEPGPEGASGRFEFGPLAVTSALCPPPSLDEPITSQAKFFRSYLLKDGRLNLSLMADGGIYVWEPLGLPADPELEAAILKASPSYTKAVVDQPGAAMRGRYVYSRVDLNGDGQDEVFVYLLGSVFCGTGGCNLMVFTREASGYRLVNDTSTSRPPVIVAESKTGGWSDFWRLQSGGGAPASFVLHTFDGKKYTASQKVDAGRDPKGRICLAADLSFAQGIPLNPRE